MNEEGQPTKVPAPAERASPAEELPITAIPSSNTSSKRSIPTWLWFTLTAALTSGWSAQLREWYGTRFLITGTAIAILIAIWIADESRYATPVQRVGPWVAGALYITFPILAQFTPLPTTILVIAPSLLTASLIILLGRRGEQVIDLMGIGSVGVGIALLGGGIASITNHHLTLGIALIGVCIAIIVAAIAAMAGHHLTLGIALIVIGISLIGGGIGIAMMAGNNLTFGIGGIVIGIAAIGGGIAAATIGIIFAIGLVK